MITDLTILNIGGKPIPLVAEYVLTILQTTLRYKAEICIQKPVALTLLKQKKKEEKRKKPL